MKKYLLIALFIIANHAYAQTPNAFNYQAVVKDTNDNVIANANIGLQIIIREASATGTELYTETHTIGTNSNGMFAIAVGTGTTTDDFTAIDWSANSHYLETSIDISGGTNYNVLGASQLLSVPYAIQAKTVEQGDNLGNHTATQDIELSTHNINGVGTTSSNVFISTASSDVVKTASLNGGEGIVMPGVTSDYIVSVQDGNGRVQHKWNASYGTGETFIVGGEDAAFIDIKGNAADGNAAWIEFKHADGAGAGAGTPISWNTQLIINQAGEVGINETNPDDMLHVTSGGNGTRLRAENSGNGWAGVVSKNTIGEIFMGVQGAFDANPGEFHIFDNVAGARRMVIDASGNFGIGRNNPTVKLDVNGSVNCTGGTCSSDVRWKKKITTLPNVIANLKQLRGVSYYWKASDFPNRDFTADKQIGVIAQEVEKVYPELVKTDRDGYKSMDYMSFTAVLLEAVKSQQVEIEALKSKVDEINELKEMLISMQAQLNNSDHSNRKF